MALVPDWRVSWVLTDGRWDEDGASFIAEALRTGDWETVAEFAAVIDWDSESAC